MNLEALAAEIKSLSPAARLRLAADLLDRRRPDVAHTIANGVVVELGAALALHALERRSGS